MRSLDLFLGALGLTALALVLSSVPAVEASDAALAGGTRAEADGDPVQGLPLEGPVELRTGQGQDVEIRRDESNLRCCGGRLSPAERAARFRTLRRVLAPSGSSDSAVLDRLRLDLLLQREAALTAAEEREIS